MRYLWLAAALALTLLVGLLAGIALAGGGSGGQGSGASSPRTVTVEKTVPAHTPPHPKTATNAVRNLDEARAAFERAVEGYGNPNLELSEAMEFTNNYYAEVEEKDTGIGAMELLIGRPGGRVYQEPGPNMMWNTKYGMMSGSGGYGRMMGPGSRGMMGPNGGGMIGGYSSAPSKSSQGNTTGDKMPVSSDQARKIANAYPSRVSPGTKAEEPERFYVYYTKDTLFTGVHRRELLRTSPFKSSANFVLTAFSEVHLLYLTAPRSCA